MLAPAKGAMVPPAHVVHEDEAEAPVVARKDPAGHLLQANAAAAVEYVPTEQPAQIEEPVVGAK